MADITRRLWNSVLHDSRLRPQNTSPVQIAGRSGAVWSAGSAASLMDEAEGPAAAAVSYGALADMRGHPSTHAPARLNEDEEHSPCLARRKGGEHTVKMWTGQRDMKLDVLMILWGLGTWVGVNGLYVQLPLLVERLPEGWALPSSMVVAVQLANVGMLAYGLVRRLLPRVPDAAYIHCLLLTGTLALCLNAWLHERTATVGHTERSVAFLTLTFFAALVGCTSSVLFYPYLRHFRDIYLATYLVGEGLSGFVPSILALAQGVGGEPECLPDANNTTLVAHYPPPRFESDVFLLLLGVLSATSQVSFLAINGYGGFRSQRVAPAAVAKDEEARTPRESLLRPRWVAVLVLMGVLNALNNGMLPSIQSYSCMPYGTQAYHLAVTLGAMANPAACLAGVWLRPVPARALAALLAVTVAPLCFIVATALLSPAPPLQHRPTGVVLIVLSWVCVSGCVSYARMWVYGWARAGGARGMRACGASTQLGSAAGSLLLFALVNYTRLFTQPDTCPALPLPLPLH